MRDRTRQPIDTETAASISGEGTKHRERQHPVWMFVRSSVSALLAVVAVLCLVVLLIRLIAPAVDPPHDGLSRRARAEVEIAAIECAVKECSIRNGGKYPDDLEVLVTPDANGHTFLDTTRLPKDPWGHEYIYEPPGPGQPQPIIRSYGRDGQPGGEGDDADVDNVSLRRQ